MGFRRVSRARSWLSRPDIRLARFMSTTSRLTENVIGCHRVWSFASGDRPGSGRGGDDRMDVFLKYVNGRELFNNI